MEFDFDFLRKVAPSKPDTAPPSDSVPPGASNPAAGAVDAARNAASAALQSPERRRGRPRKNPQDGGGNQPNLSAELKAEIAQQLEGLYDPRAWGSLLAAPGDVALALTGREHWEIGKEERATLGATGSAMARTLLITNPKTLAALMLGSALLSVYLPRAMIEVKRLAAERKKAPDGGKKD